MSSTSSSRGRHVAVKSKNDSYNGHPSPMHSHTFSESSESLRALELSEGPESIELRPSPRTRTASISLFQFQDELLPLSLSEAVERTEDVVVEKTVGFYNGEFRGIHTNQSNDFNF